MRTLITCLAVGVALAFTASASAATKPGWTLAKTSAHIEFNLRLADPELVSQAQNGLRLAKVLGGPETIANMERDLKIAKAGYSIDRASCLGTKAAPGGYVAFKCKLGGSISLGFTLKSVGVWKRIPTTGKWRYIESSRSYDGYGPSWWKNP